MIYSYVIYLVENVLWIFLSAHYYGSSATKKSET